MKKIYKVVIALLFILSLAFTVNAQNLFFTDINESAIQTGNSKRVIIPQKFRAVSLNNQQLKKFLWSLPSERNITNRKQTPVLELPAPNGRIAKFHIWESSIQEPALAAKFPDIKTFTGQGIDDPYATIRLDYSPYGFHAQVLTINGSYYIDPYARGMVNDYISYYRKDFTKTGTIFCEVPDNTVAPPPINGVTAQCLGTDLRTYRLAVACTGEYAQAPGINAGTNAAILHAAIVTSVNRVVGVYETEVSIRMILVANNNVIEYLNASTDPFNGNNNANVLINESQTVIDANIGFTNYDIGHTFSTGGGGLAQLNSPCGGSKARGITGSPNPTGDPYDIDYVAHEMGHQFGGNHSMAGCGSSPTSTKYEVGSGTTIQAYAGICGAENIQPNSDPYFHPISFDEISNFVTTGGGSTCGTSTPTGNTLPVIDPLPNNGLSIPPGTPFTLTGSASDANGDPLTYCWEQWDFSGTATWNAGATAPVNNTVPLFKSRVPKTTGSRTFPDMAVILAGFPTNPPSAMGGLKGETLSPVARTMKFRLTVRDNRAAGGGVVSSGSGCQGTSVFQVSVVGTTPFTLSAPNGGESWPGGSTQSITWNTAGTQIAPVGVTNVKISLSTDGGATYPTVLAASTANDGNEALAIPSGATSAGRIKVEAIGNIFFDISNVNFTITAPVTGFDFSGSAPASVACGSATSATITLGTISNGGYVVPINLSATGNPAGTTVSFSVNPLTPGNSTDVTLNSTNTLSAGSYNIVVTGVSGAITQTKTLTYTVNPGTGPSITLQPAAQLTCAGSPASFSITSATATAYQWQVSTDGGTNFSNITGATATNYSIVSTLASQNNYQYRCIVIGQCNTTTSAAAILTVNTPPAITTQPAASTICASQNTSFTVAATGTTLTYQWQVSTNGCSTFSNLANGAPYSGVTSATLTITGAATGLNNSSFRCLINGACPGTATTNCTLLTVNTPLAVTSPPANSTLCAGAAATFTVAVTGTAPTYQWQESTNGGNSFTNINNGGIYSGATTAAVNLTGITAGMNNYQYRCIISGATSCAAVNSANAVLTVNTAPAITAQPVASTTLCAGSNITYTATANGTALNYQWQLSTAGAGGPWSNVTNGGVYSGATTGSLVITAATAAMSGYQYRSVVDGTCAPAATTTNAALIVNTPISITAQPAANTNICATGSTSFTTAVTGTSPTYQWQESTNGGTTWTNVTNGGIYLGATTNTLSLAGITASMNSYRYRNVITGTAPCGFVNSNSAVLNVTPQPVISIAPLTSLSAGQQTTLTVNVTPAPGLSFAWNLEGTLLPLATGNSLIATVNELGKYQVIVTSATGSCTSELKEITAAPSTRLFIFPSPSDGLFTVSYYTEGASLTNKTKQSIVVYDSYGRSISNKEYTVSQAYQLHKIDLRRNSSGVYYIVLREANGNKIKTGEVLIR